MLRFFVFSIGSVISNGTGFLVAYAANSLIDSPVWATSLGFVAALGVGYFFQSRVTYSSSKRNRKVTGTYLGLYLLGFIFNAFLVHVETQVLSLPFAWSQVIAMGVSGILMYLGLRYWVFRRAAE